MITIISTLLTFLLIIVCVFMVFVILLQRSSSDGGLGTAFGGGIAESTFGADTGNILTKATIYAAVLFFVISLGLYLIYMSKAGISDEEALPNLGVTSEAVDTTGEASSSSDELTSVPMVPLGETAPEATDTAVDEAVDAVEKAVDASEETPATEPEG